MAIELERRLKDGRDTAYDYCVLAELWPEVEGWLRAEREAADLGDIAREAASRSGVKVRLVPR